jgi:hypothetical protein
MFNCLHNDLFILMFRRLSITITIPCIFHHLSLVANSTFSKLAINSGLLYLSALFFYFQPLYMQLKITSAIPGAHYSVMKVTNTDCKI